MIILVPYSFYLTLVGRFCEGAKQIYSSLVDFFTSKQEELRFWLSCFKQFTDFFELALPYYTEVTCEASLISNLECSSNLQLLR